MAWGGGGGILQLKSQSAKISDNFREKVGNLDFPEGGGGGYSATSPRFLTIFLFRGGGGGGVFCNFGFGLREKVGNLDFPGGGGILQLKSQSAKISDNFRGGGGNLQLQDL